MNDLRLDDLYKMVAHIYSEQNLARTGSATFCHFAEVCGMLTIHDRRKKREDITVTDALCKALGWYFPLLAKHRVRSVEDLIYRKFPYVCPYCRLAPHEDAKCKVVMGTKRTVDHTELQKFYKENASKKPVTLNAWQKMFQEIYPRSAEDRGRSTIGLLEELGELAESIRVFEKYPKYFAGEAADIFSYLMGIANEHAIRMAQEEDEDFSFEDEFLKRYPGLCVQCGSRVCSCPTVPDATVGRMAKELEIGAEEALFIEDLESFTNEGSTIAHAVLERIGGYSGLVDRFPFDRGDANRALITLCLRIAEAVQTERPKFAETLRAEAVRLGTAATYAGSPKKPADLSQLLDDIKLIWRGLDKDLKSDITSDGGLVAEIGGTLGAIRVLFVSCSPADQEALRVSSELRAIRESLKLGEKGNKVIVVDLPAATTDDLRRALLINAYDIVHFSGHASKDILVFETADGKTISVPLTAIGDLIRRHKEINCVILNGCDSARELNVPLCAYTVGMVGSIADDAAIEFSRGFYDALSAGKDIDFAIGEGTSAMDLKGFDGTSVKILRE